MEKQIPADLILKTIDTWVRWAFPSWQLEKEIERYANGGSPPSDDPEFEDNIVPLGFAQSYMKREFAPLKDALLLKPGIVDAVLVTPALKIPERTLTIQSQVNEVINKVIMPMLAPELKNMGGRATVTGRAVLFRKSPNEVKLKCGRIIHPPEAGTDILDSEFREWAFPGQLTLRDIDGHLRNSSKGKYGWNREGLEQLKLWIMATESQKYGNGSVNTPEWAQVFNRDSWLEYDLTRTGFTKPVDVYWYFRKNGKITRAKDDLRFAGHEKLDLYCISRFGNEKAVVSQMKDAFTREKSYSIEYKKDFEQHLEKLEKDAGDWKEAKEKHCNDRLLFYMPDIFKSVADHMILHLDDEAIAGEQRLSEVLGVGKMAMPKLAVTEQLLTSITEGLAFVAQPNWTVRAGQDQEYLKHLQRTRVRSGQPFPEGIKPMEKNNVFQGFSQAMGFIRMLDTATAADSAANNQGTFGGSQAEFAAQAQAELAGKQMAVSSRLENWLQTLDKVVDLVVRTLCMEWSKMRKEFPCYEDADRLRITLKTRYGIHEDEWDQERWDYSARRLAGGMMRQQSIGFNIQMLQTVGAADPSLAKFFVKEILRAGYGDTTAEQLTNPQQEVTMAQEGKARQNVATTFITGQPVPATAADDPVVHSRIAVEVLEGRLQAAQSAGTIMPSEVVGLMAIIQFAAQHIAKIGAYAPNFAKPALERLGQLGEMVQSIPVQQPQQEGALTQKDMAELAIKDRNQSRLEQAELGKQADREFGQMVQMKKLAQSDSQSEANQKNLAVQRANGMVDVQTKLNELDTSDDPLGLIVA